MSSCLNEKSSYNKNDFSSLLPILRVEMVLREVKRKRDEMSTTCDFYAFTKDYAIKKANYASEFRVKILLNNKIKEIEKEESASSDEEFTQIMSPPKRHNNKENVFFSRQLSCDEDDFELENMNKENMMQIILPISSL